MPVVCAYMINAFFALDLVLYAIAYALTCYHGAKFCSVCVCVCVVCVCVMCVCVCACVRVCVCVCVCIRKINNLP